jgi:hypothetical protein
MIPMSDNYRGTGILAHISRENLAVYRESPARLQEDVSQEAQVAHDYRGRLVYEILQNADDALLDVASTDDRALFRLTDDELWVANTGRPFSDADVRGLCGLGASSKAHSDGRKRASIGHKGLGFKSVLEITDAPEAFSDTVCFRFGRANALPQVEALWAELQRGPVRDVPAMRFPSPVSESHPVWEELRKAGFHSAFRFPFRSALSGDQRQILVEQLLTLPMTSILFLKHLEEVVIEVRTESQRIERQWLLERHRISSSGEAERCGGLTSSGLYRVDLVDRDDVGRRFWVGHSADVEIGAHRDGLTGPAWDGVDVSEVSVAVLDGENPRLPHSDRRFHVFLPTQESVGCSILVNGAFTTDLSRQHVRVSGMDEDYNSHLVRQAAEVFRDILVPYLISQGGARYVLQVLDQREGTLGDAASLLSDELANALASTPMLPSDGYLLTFAETVLPSPVLGERGADLAGLLEPGSGNGSRRFPDPDYCNGEWAAVCADYGAVALSPAATLGVLAECVAPAQAGFRLEPGGRFHIDPVLELCTVLWENADAADRQELEAIAPSQTVFPIGEREDRSVNRISLRDESAFYPPRSSAENLPLRRLKFLAHAVCWGSLGRTEQRSVLERQMKAWDALFDIKEFRFEEVMRAAVLPGLTRAVTADQELRASNRSIEALATICRLAGKTTKPDQPLPMGRLGSDRAFFNLSRLEVPCRTTSGADPVWAPAYQVYFGRDWVGADSVEDLVDAMAKVGNPMEVHFLAPPSAFEPYAAAIGVETKEEQDRTESAGITDDGEVDLEDDTDEVLETTADDRWRNFFAWLGVSRGLRLVHFHDVDDSGTGWTSTKGLTLPGGWAFAGLAEPWAEYKSDLEHIVGADPRWDSTDHYLYQVHNLDRLDEIVAVARLKDNDVAQRLLDHLVRNWHSYARHTHAELALVGAGKWPSSRTAPPRATTEELVVAGPDLWLFRLRHHAICPTSHGPRRPSQTWRRSAELLRRFGRSRRKADDLLPVLKEPTEVPAGSLRVCLDELEVRGELTPAAFTVDDAHDLCVRIADIYADGVSEQALRTELRPVYRQMFELLVGSPTSTSEQLAEIPLAARTPAGITFLPAKDVVYASVSGSRERSGIQDKVPLFVLEAEPGALAPLRNIFGTPLLETALEWDARPDESALDDEQLDRFRQGLQELIPPLLARLSADRPERGSADRRAILEFVGGVEPVSSLTLNCSFRGKELGEVSQRTYYVKRAPESAFLGFVTWTGPAWPPAAEDAQTLAMALAEALEVNTVETFLSFINATPDQRRQLLDLAGASERLREVELELAAADGTSSDIHDGSGPASEGLEPTDGNSIEVEHEKAQRKPATAPTQAAPRIPLYRFEDLLMDGEVMRIKGAETANDHGQRTTSASSEANNDAGPRAAAGMDLDGLDRLGMQITLAFERWRLSALGAVILPGETSPEGVDALVVDVSSPGVITAAVEQSTVVKKVFDWLAGQGISSVYPGFDILTIRHGKVDRLIELKSSGVDAHVQAMSWNEWKTAGGTARSRFWLYLVGNLRSDLYNTEPFLRAVHDPFGTLSASTAEDSIRRRSVQLRVREFAAADQLTLEVRRGQSPPSEMSQSSKPDATSRLP